MSTTKKYIVEIDAETGELVSKVAAGKKEIKGLDKEANKTSKSFNALGSQVDAMTGGLLTMGKKGVASVRGLSLGFKGLRAAIISTGIGAIVVGVVALIQAVSRLQGVQDRYKQASAALGAVFDVLLDSVAFLGEALIAVFENPQKAIENLWELIKENVVNRFEGLKKQFTALGTILEGIFELDFDKVKQGTLEYADATVQAVTGVEDLAGKIQEYGNRLSETAQKAADLAKAEQELEVLRISQIETQAERNKQIAEARLLAEDETLSLEARQEALANAIELEKQNLAEKVENAREEARIIAEQNALSESSREDDKREAEARARVLELEAQSAKQRKRLTAELESLRREAESKAKARRAEEAKRAQERQKELEELAKAEQEYLNNRIKAEDEIYAALFDQQATAAEKEVAAIEAKYNKLLDLADQYGLERNEIEAARDAEQLEATRKREERITALINDAQGKREMSDDEKFFAELQKKQEQAELQLEQIGATEAQIQELRDNFNRQRAQRNEEINAKIDAKEAEDAEKRKEYERQVQEAKVNLAMQGAQALTGLIEAFGGESERNAKRVFNINKALGIADAVINTARAIGKSLAETTDPTPTQSLRFANAAIAGALGVAQVAKIASTRFQSSGGGGGGGRPSLSAPGGNLQPTGAPQIPQAPVQGENSIRAFVVEKNVTTAQSQNQKINEQALLTQ